MATVKYRLRSKANKEVTIYVYVSLGRGNMIQAKTGFTINPNGWSNSLNKPKQNKATNKRLTADLNQLSNFIFDEINLANSKGNLIDLFWLKNKIDECFDRTEKGDNSLLINHIQYMIDNANTRVIQGSGKVGLSKSRIKSYKSFKNIIINYQKYIKSQIHFKDINKQFMDKFINWLINIQAYTKNYTGKTIDNLKTVCTDAEKLEIKVNPYAKQIKGFSETNDERHIATLSFDEIETIKNTELTNEALKNVRKWLLIGCEIGQRASDLLTITKDNIRYSEGVMYLDVLQQKTKKEITVSVNSDYLIDLIENEMPYKVSIQKLNTHLKKLCKIAGIDEVIEGKKNTLIKTIEVVENGVKKTKKVFRKVLGKYPKHELISSHTFRRSFATNYYKKMPTPILINITGHSKESMFLAYINRQEDKDENAKLFMKFYKDIHKDKEKTLKVV